MEQQSPNKSDRPPQTTQRNNPRLNAQREEQSPASRAAHASPSSRKNLGTVGPSVQRTVLPVIQLEEQPTAKPASPSSVQGGPSHGREQAVRRSGHNPWRIVFWVALVVLVCSLAALGYIGFSYWNGQRSYDSLVDEAFAVSDESGTNLTDFQVDWDRLRAINPDVVGWVYIPGTSINYPVACRAGDDDYYLYHNFSGDSAPQFAAEYGSIMLSGENDPDFTDQVNFIFGHNMSNGMMFAYFNEFRDAAVFNAHRTVYLLTPGGNYALTTFAIDHVLGSDPNIMKQNFANAQELQAYVQERMDSSLVTPDPPAPPAADITKVFAFSTCDPDNTYRNITFAYVDEFLPAGATEPQTGASGTGDENESLINPDDVSNVNNSAEERAS